MTYTATGMPAGLSINSKTGVISGTPTFESAGTYNVTLSVFDSGTPSLGDTENFVWTITDVNRAPIALDQSLGAAAGLPIDVTLSGTDPDGDVLIFEIVDEPLLGVAIASGGGTITYVAPAEVAGLDVFTFRVGDGALWSDPATVTVSVGANSAPVAVGESFAIDPGATIDVPAPGLLGNDSDPDGAALTSQLATPPRHGSLSLSANGSFIYRHEGATGVTDTFSYVVFDGLRTSPPVVVRIVIAANIAPSALDDVLGLDEDTTAEFNPLENDSDVENHELSLLSISQPEVGTIVRLDGGTIRYTPIANWFGTDVATYEIVDEYGGVDTAQITFVVASVNDAPTATGLWGSVEADERYLDIDLTGEFGDVDADAIEIVLSTPRHGTAVLVGENVVRYQPTDGFRGSDSFTYTISDGNGGTATATIAISVDGIDADAIALDVVGFDRPAAASLNDSNSFTTTFRSFRLVVGSVFNTMELFRLPMLILLLGFLGTALTGWRRTLGPSSGAIHLPGGDPKSWSVVFVDDSAQLIGRVEPGNHSDPVHRFVAAETALRGTGATALLGDETWIEIDSASGAAWVPASMVTEAVPPGRFAGDESVTEAVRELRTVIADQGSIDGLLSDRGLAISHFAPPQRFTREFAAAMMGANQPMTWWSRTGGVPSLEGTFHNVIARPLAMSLDRYETRANADVSAAIPTE
ncbi:MAG: tandem-95 repeat protein, partial [Acidimicrobiia bacterium]|nr:tandem-95 repeat protein [Acidimicrobiia bacterium]